MDPFVRRLVERLQDTSRPLSRNRHFHTFETPEGRAAMRTFRRLRSLQADILACGEEGGRARCVPARDAEGTLRVELRLERLRGQRTSVLPQAEWELLAALPGMRELLEVEGESEPA